MGNIKKKVAKILLDIHAVTLRSKKPFRYTSGILSPVYTDCRLIISHPEQRRIIKDFYLTTIKKSRISFDVVAGTSTAGIPWAALIADAFNLPMIYVRSKTKEHGRRNQIEGLIKKGQEAIVIEDLISTGGSSIETVNAIRDSGSTASYIFSVMTYGIKKAEINFKKNKIKLVSLTDFKTVTNIAYKKNYIDKKDQKIILEWVKDPTSWGKKMVFEV